MTAEPRSAFDDAARLTGPDAQSARDRRRSDRYATGVRVTVRVLGREVEAAGEGPGQRSRSGLVTDAISQAHAPVRARALDISEGGTRVRVRRHLVVGQRVGLDIECEIPLQVHLGFDARALVIDGPLHTHLVRLEGYVAWVGDPHGGLRDVGIEFCADTDPGQRSVVQSFVDHLRTSRSPLV